MTYPIDPNTFVDQANALNYKVEPVAQPTTPLDAFLQEFGTSTLFYESDPSMAGGGGLSPAIESSNPNPALVFPQSFADASSIIQFGGTINGTEFLTTGQIQTPEFGSFTVNTGWDSVTINFDDGVDFDALIASQVGPQMKGRINFGGLTSFDDFINKLAAISDANPNGIGIPEFTSGNFSQTLRVDVPNPQSPPNIPTFFNYNHNISFIVNLKRTNDGATFNALMEQFGSFLGFDYDADDPDMDLGELSVLEAVKPSNQTNKEFVESIFNNAFSAYLRSDLAKEGIEAGPAGAIVPPGFFNNWKTFLTNISAMSGPTPGTYGGTVFPNVNTYRDIYLHTVPGATQDSFEEAFRDFYTNPHGIVQKSDYFLPSHFLGEWVKQAGADRIRALGLDGIAAVTNSNETEILFRVFFLLEKMLQGLQSVAVSQANKETFYANIQSEYTSLISKIPVFTVANLHATGFFDDAGQENNRLQAITNKNQSYTQNLQAFRDLFGDQSKQQQTAIDQSNQEVSQQANLATTILQQMSTIVQSIFGH